MNKNENIQQPKIILKVFESDNSLDLQKNLRKEDISTRIQSIKLFQNQNQFTGFEITYECNNKFQSHKMYQNQGHNWSSNDKTPVDLILDSEEKISSIQIRQGAITDAIKLITNKKSVQTDGSGGGSKTINIPDNETLVAISVTYEGVIGRTGFQTVSNNNNKISSGQAADQDDEQELQFNDDVEYHLHHSKHNNEPGSIDLYKKLYVRDKDTHISNIELYYNRYMLGQKIDQVCNGKIESYTLYEKGGYQGNSGPKSTSKLCTINDRIINIGLRTGEIVDQLSFTTEKGMKIEGGGQGGGLRIMNIQPNMEIIGLQGTASGCLNSVGFWLKPISRWRERKYYIIQRYLGKSNPQRLSSNLAIGKLLLELRSYLFQNIVCYI